MSELLDFLDAEFCLQREEEVWKASAVAAGEEIRAASAEPDKELQRGMAVDVRRRREAVFVWLRRVRSERVRLPGSSLIHSYGWMGGLAVVLGLVLGIGASNAALAAREGTPINLWLFLGLLIFLQVGLLLGAVVFASWAKARGQVWLGFLGRLTQGFHRWSWARSLTEEDVLGAVAETSKVERWIWLGITQRFAVFFNLGAVLGFLGLLLFSELQFGWSTTPEDFKPELLDATVQVLAAPWAWAAPDSWLPSSDFIVATRWDALAGSFQDPTTDGRGWWPFLLMTLIIWGLLPRLVLNAWMSAQKRKALAGLPWNHRGYQRLFEVMFPLPAASDDDTDLPEHAPLVDAPATSSDDGLTILWGDWANSLEAQTALPHGGSHGSLCAGNADAPTDQEILQQVQQVRPQELWLLVEAGESPDKRFTGFLTDLRGILGKERPIQVLPVEYRNDQWSSPTSRDMEIWTRTLLQLRDRYLSVRQSGTP
ncbi:MAG: DUF2868 domain-containing protein [Planctomycetota bacterium]|jgi:hypothetical protein